MKNKLTVLLLTLVLLVGLLAGCSGEKATVNVQSVAMITGYGTAGAFNTCAGVVVAQNEIKIERKDDRKVAELRVAVGQEVKTGDVLFVYDMDEMKLTIEKAELEIESLKNNITDFDTRVAQLEKEKANAPASEQLSYTVQIQSLQADKKEAQYNLTVKEKELEALKETGVEISSFIVVYRWSGPTEEQRQHAVANWKRMIEIAVDMGVPVINTEFSGDPNQQEICNGMFFKSMEELLPIIEREGIRVECQSHPYDFVELNDEACDIVKSFRSKNLGYVYSASHGFFYDQGKGDVRHMLKYAGDELTHVLLADTWNQTKDCRYIVNPPWLNQHGRADYTIHQHTAMGEGEVDFDGIFETLRDMDFANKQLKPDAPKVGGDNIICVSYFGFPEKMDQQAPEALDRIKHELL